MDAVKVIEVKKSVLKNNAEDAKALRKELSNKGVLYINIMSSPGSGKTTTLMATINHLGKDLRVGVMEADIDSDVDAKTIATSGVKTIQLHTGGMCHLDAEMSKQGLDEMGIDDLDLVFLENVGNLVCPAEFDSGSHLNVAILSVPEGDDKPLKYPLIFEECDVVLVSKIDSLPAFDFDMERFKENVLMRNPNSVIFPVSGRTGEGIDAWCDWLKKQVKEQKNG